MTQLRFYENVNHSFVEGICTDGIVPAKGDRVILEDAGTVREYEVVARVFDLCMKDVVKIVVRRITMNDMAYGGIGK